MLQKLTSNLSGSIKTAKLEGREYLVAPVVLLTEGVHAGSNGPLYYPASELEASAPTWNHKPIVVYHPMVNGEYVSADSEEVVQNQKIGFLLNVRWNPKKRKLQGEAWIEQQKAREVDQRVINSLAQNLVMEVSTGLFTDNDDEPGEWRGISFNSTTRNYRPDHLAVLPDQKGACSVAAGCGLLQLNHSIPILTANRLTNIIERELDLQLNYSESYDDTRRVLDSLLRKKFTVPASSLSPSAIPAFPWIQDVYPSFLVYELEGTLYLQRYGKNEAGGYSLVGDAEEVIKSTVYRSKDGVVLNEKDSRGGKCSCGGTCDKCTEASLASNLTNEDQKMDKEKVIANMLASGVWNDGEDKEWLESLPLDRLQSLAAKKMMSDEEEEGEPSCNSCGMSKTISDTAGDDVEMTEEEADAGGVDKSGKRSKVIPGGKKPQNAAMNSACSCTVANCSQRQTTNQEVTLDQYIAAAPAPIREFLANGVEAETSRRQGFIDRILANSSEFTKEELLKCNTKWLQRMANMTNNSAQQQVGVPYLEIAPLYLGAAGAPPVTNNAVANEEPLTVPTMNFSSES